MSTASWTQAGRSVAAMQLRVNCECGYVGGPYVPMCPFRPHGVTGLARGDMYKRLRAAWDGRGDWEWEEPPEDLSPWYSKRGVNVSVGRCE